MIVTEAIAAFLNANARPDLAKLYNPGMEVQVNVLPAGGQPIDARTYTDGVINWFNFRIPKNARTEPEFVPWELNFPLSEKAQAIGLTGWNFERRVSRHVAFDFDSICSHKGTGVSDSELSRVKEAAFSIPWVEIRRSTRGGGLHLRVYLPDIATANHTEHAALARAILNLMGTQVGFDFASGVDVCGGNLWIWHRDATPDGYELLKPADCLLTQIPDNWREHASVVRRKAKRVSLGLPNDAQASLSDIADSISAAPLDSDHRQLMEWLEANGWPCIWEPDYSLIRTHTKGLEEAHRALRLRGYFETSSAGTDRAKCNCFAFPLASGAWKVYRYGGAVNESALWTKTDSWTYTYLNRPPSFEAICRFFGGIEDSDKGFVFNEREAAERVIASLGGEARLPETASKQVKLKKLYDGEAVSVELKRAKGEAPPPGFIEKSTSFKKVVKIEQAQDEVSNEYDSFIRCLFTPANQPGGWVMRVGEEWVYQPKNHIISVLMGRGLTMQEALSTCGKLIENGWRLINAPFQPEYPGGRRWNKDAAQLRFSPSEEDGKEHPHWDSILAHCGQGINEAVLSDEWCMKHGIVSGQLYLMHWLASILKFPYEPLPYLFFFSEPYQNCGKSTFHESISLLLTRGVVRADQALQSASNFNGELKGAVLCVIEETDLSQVGSRAYNKIKDWITSRQIMIHTKGLTPYMIENTLHWVQCSNSQAACPIFEGDTRVCIIPVMPLQPGQEIPWPRLKTKLEEEAPAFLRTLLDLNVPPSNGRLRIPVVETAEKRRAMELTMDELRLFLRERCYYVPGAKMKFSDFYDAFVETLPPLQREKWTRYRVSSSLPSNFPTGRCGEGVTYIGNISFEDVKVEGEPKPYVRYSGRLVRVEKEETE